MTSDNKHYLYTELYERLQSDESLFAWFEEGATDGMWYWDLTNPEHEWLSPRFKAIFGYREDEIPHTSAWWQEHIFPEDLPGVLDNFEKHKADPSHPYDQIVRYRHKDGKTIWVRCRGLIIRDEHGEPSRMLGAHTDLTSLMESRQQQERTSRQLERTTEELSEINRLALSTSQIGLWRWDLNDDALVWDQALYDMYQIEPSDDGLNINDWWSRIHPEDADSLKAKLEAAIHKGAPYRTTFRALLPDGSLRFIKAAADVYYDDAGKPVRMRGANWDITEEKLREAELERSNRDLSTFAYVASHDLKAPLRGIRQLASWIREDLPDPPAEVNEHIELMQGRIERLESLLDDLLAYSRASQAGDRYQKEVVSPEVILRDVFEILTPPDEVTLTIQGSFEAITVEKPLFEQVLINLLGNAIKHRTEAGGQIRVWAEDNPTHYEFHVADTNTPIAEEYHLKIFEMFQTLRPRDEVEGSGMGLAIPRRILHERGGKIRVITHTDETDDVPTGNEFIFTWPRA